MTNSVTHYIYIFMVQVMEMCLVIILDSFVILMIYDHWWRIQEAVLEMEVDVVCLLMILVFFYHIIEMPYTLICYSIAPCRLILSNPWVFLLYSKLLFAIICSPGLAFYCIVYIIEIKLIKIYDKKNSRITNSSNILAIALRIIS